MGAHLKMFAAIFVFMWRANHAIGVLLSRQGTGPATVAPVRSTVSTIFFAEESITSWS